MAFLKKMEKVKDYRKKGTRMKQMCGVDEGVVKTQKRAVVKKGRANFHHESSLLAIASTLLCWSPTIVISIGDLDKNDP